MKDGKGNYVYSWFDTFRIPFIGTFLSKRSYDVLKDKAVNWFIIHTIWEGHLYFSMHRPQYAWWYNVNWDRILPMLALFVSIVCVLGSSMSWSLGFFLIGLLIGVVIGFKGND